MWTRKGRFSTMKVVVVFNWMSKSPTNCFVICLELSLLLQIQIIEQHIHMENSVPLEKTGNFGMSQKVLLAMHDVRNHDNIGLVAKRRKDQSDGKDHVWVATDRRSKDHRGFVLFWISTDQPNKHRTAERGAWVASVNMRWRCRHVKDESKEFTSWIWEKLY